MEGKAHVMMSLMILFTLKTCFSVFLFKVVFLIKMFMKGKAHVMMFIDEFIYQLIVFYIIQWGNELNFFFFL